MAYMPGATGEEVARDDVCDPLAQHLAQRVLILVGSRMEGLENLMLRVLHAPMLTLGVCCGTQNGSNETGNCFFHFFYYFDVSDDDAIRTFLSDTRR